MGHIADYLNSTIKDNVQYGMFKIGDTVNQEFNMPMKVIGFDCYYRMER